MNQQIEESKLTITNGESNEEPPKTYRDMLRNPIIPAILGVLLGLLIWAVTTEKTKDADTEKYVNLGKEVETVITQAKCPKLNGDDPNHLFLGNQAVATWEQMLQLSQERVNQKTQ